MNKDVHILLIEDNPDDVEILQEKFREFERAHNHFFNSALLTITVKETLHEALVYLKEDDTVNVIMLDITLPDTFGLSGLEKLNDDFSSVPVIILTGLDDAHQITQYLQNGAQDYLIKGSITDEVLYRALRYTLERHKLLTMLKELALFDELTGLYNFRGFATVVDSKMKIAIRDKQSCLLYRIVLNNYTMIEEKFGRNESHEAVIQGANILKQCFRDSDTIGRTGPSEFAVLAFRAGEQTVDVISKRLDNALHVFNNESIKGYSLSLVVTDVQNIDHETVETIQFNKRNKN